MSDLRPDILWIVVRDGPKRIRGIRSALARLRLGQRQPAEDTVRQAIVALEVDGMVTYRKYGTVAATAKGEDILAAYVVAAP